MNGRIKKIKGIFPVTTSKAVFMDGTSTTLNEFLSGMSGGNVNLTGVVKSVNGNTPDENGNVEIAISGGGVDVSGLGIEFAGSTLSLVNGSETIDEVELPTIPTPVSNPRTNCVLTVAGTGGSGFLMAGVLLKNPTLATTLELDIDVEILEGTTTYVQPWVYSNPTFNGNQSNGGTLTQMTNKSYSSGKTNYTFSQTKADFGAEYSSLLFKIPDTVTKYQITFNSTGVFQIERTIKNSTFCGDLDTLTLTYEQEYSSLRLLSRWSGKRYLALGDSLTDKNYNTPDYPSLLKDIMGFSVVDNLGASGQTMSTANSANNLTSSKKSRSYDYDLITIMLGVNDFTFGNCDVGDVTATEYDTATFAGAYRDVLDYIIENNPKAMIVLIQPIYCGSQNTANSFGKTLEDYREAVRQIADIYNLPTVNLRIGFNAKTTAVFMQSDRLHLTPEGQRRIADVLGQFLCTV